MTTTTRLRSGAGARLLVAFLVGAAPALMACRIIIPPDPWPPRPMPPPERVLQPMEVKSHKATIDIKQSVATVTVEAVFYNPNPTRIEGTYLFPIGKRAAVSSFAMTVNGKTMEAELLEAGKARDIYENIVRQMRDPALLEYVEDGLLKARVFPIEPGKDIKVQLTYEEALGRDSGMLRFSYPLLSARPDGDGKVGSLVIDVTIDNDLPLKNVFVPGYQVDIKRPSAKQARLTFETGSYRPERDFEILFGESERRVGVDMLTYRKGDDGYFLMLVAPDSELQAEEIAAKDLTLVLDSSGSMMGDKIKQAKDALLFCVNSLNPDDTFNIVTFATDVVPLAEASVPATAANQGKAREFIRGIKPRGGTAIDEALAFVLDRPARPDAVTIVAFLTDGIPTIGEVDPTVILKRLAERQDAKRIFTFGVGYDVNTRLLNGVADRTHGYSTYVVPGENLELALSAFYEKIAYPVMTALAMESEGFALSKINPKNLPDLFRGAQLAVTGRFTGDGKGKVTISGTVGDARESFMGEADLAGDPRNAFIPRMWAAARVGWLQEQIRLNGRSEELVNEIKTLGRHYGILTEYTSFLIVEEGIEQDRVREARQAFGKVADTMAEAESGMMAVESARRGNALKSGGLGAAIPGAAPAVYTNAYTAAGVKMDQLDQLVRQVEDKTFYFRRADGVWYDSLIPAGDKPDIDQEVIVWSKEFFALVRRFPALRRYILTSEDLVVILDGTTIRIKPEG